MSIRSTLKKNRLAIAVLGAATILSSSAALADTDLEGNVQGIVCPTDVDPGSVTVMGVTALLPVGVEVRGSTCEGIETGDFVKVKCADAACTAAAGLTWKSKVSAEGPVASVDCEFRQGFTLASGITCDVDESTKVQMKKPKGIQPWHPTLTTLFDLLCAEGTVLGTTPGTVEVKCEGDYVGDGVIAASKAQSKK